MGFASEFAEAMGGANGSGKDAVGTDTEIEFGGDLVGEGKDGDIRTGVGVVDLGEGGDEGEGFTRASASGDESVLAGGGKVKGDERLLGGEGGD